MITMMIKEWYWQYCHLSLFIDVVDFNDKNDSDEEYDDLVMVAEFSTGFPRDAAATAAADAADVDAAGAACYFCCW